MAHDQVRLFIVDDQPIESILTEILRLSGFSVTSFTRPQATPKANFYDSPDLRIFDIRTPELSGIKLATRLKEIDCNCEVFLISEMKFGLHASGLEHNLTVLPKPAPLKMKISDIV